MKVLLSHLAADKDFAEVRGECLVCRCLETKLSLVFHIFNIGLKESTFWAVPHKSTAGDPLACRGWGRNEPF